MYTAVLSFSRVTYAAVFLLAMPSSIWCRRVAGSTALMAIWSVSIEPSRSWFLVEECGADAVCVGSHHT
ncbi:MAG: hypothetical protein ACOCWH_02460 [Spirochaetota bacterium]